MTATLSPPTTSGLPTPIAESDRTARTGPNVLIILHAEFDDDEILVSLAKRVKDDRRVTLAFLRPISVGVVPANPLGGELGVMYAIELHNAHRHYEAEMDRHIRSRSALLDHLGIPHELVTATYRRTLLARGTRRHLRNAIGRIARVAHADEVMVGPGAIREALLPD